MSQTVSVKQKKFVPQRHLLFSDNLLLVSFFVGENRTTKVHSVINLYYPLKIFTTSILCSCHSNIEVASLIKSEAELFVSFCE